MKEMDDLKNLHEKMLRLADAIVIDCGFGADDNYRQLVATVYSNLLVDVRNKFLLKEKDKMFDGLMGKIDKMLGD